MDILTELFLFSPEFPIQKVFDEIGIDEGEISVLDAATYSTLSGEQFVREKEMSITYSISSNGYDGVEKSTLQLTDMLSSKKDILLKNIKEHNLSVMFCITINLSEDVEVFLPKKFVEFVAALGADIEFDTYTNDEKTIEYDETQS